MDGQRIGITLISIRRRRMWTQGKLAEKAGVSPTTISSIEGGRISRPHFGTLHKLAVALRVDPKELLNSIEAERSSQRGPSDSMSFEWAMSAREEEFEREIEEASLETLRALYRQLESEQGRLQELYEEFPRNTQQRRSVKRQIRNVAAQSGSVGASILFIERKQPTN